MAAPIVVGKTLYIHGTRSVSQALSDWPALLAGYQVPEQDAAEKLAVRERVDRVVGHSLGASWALPIARKFGLRYVGLGRPGLSHVEGDVANLGDPVSFLQFHPTRLQLGHSLGSYA